MNALAAPGRAPQQLKGEAVRWRDRLTLGSAIRRADDNRAEQVIRAARDVGILFLFLIAGCTGMKPPGPVAPPQIVAPEAAVEAAVPEGPSAGPQGPDATVPKQDAVAPVEPVTAPAAAPQTTPSTGQSAAKDTKPSTTTTAKVPPAQASKQQRPAPDIAKKREPPLDLASLEQRLKDTKAIGMLTKITLKNQVDDLLDQFRAFYQGKLRVTLAELRRSYDLLVLKVLALLQDSDPPLAAAIAASREAIWGILSDPAKFATI